jgi:hypothetical protein
MLCIRIAWSLTAYNDFGKTNHFAVKRIAFLNLVNHFAFHLLSRSRGVGDCFVHVDIKRLAQGGNRFKTFLL